MIDNDVGELIDRANFDDLAEADLVRQVVLYLQAAVIKPLAATGVASEHLAQACLESAIDIIEAHKGSLAAALMLQAATRRTFKGASRVDQRNWPSPLAESDALSA